MTTSDDVKPEGGGFTATCPGCAQPFWKTAEPHARAALAAHMTKCRKVLNT